MWVHEALLQYCVVMLLHYVVAVELLQLHSQVLSMMEFFVAVWLHVRVPPLFSPVASSRWHVQPVLALAWTVGEQCLLEEGREVVRWLCQLL